MTDNAISPLRQRMIEDMTARHFAKKAQKDFNPDAVEAALGRHASATRLGRVEFSMTESSRHQTPCPGFAPIQDGRGSGVYERFVR